MTRLIRLSFGVVLIVRLLNSEKGGSSALTLLQAMAQVPGRILQLLVSRLSTDSSGSGTTPAPAPAPAPAELWHLLWDLPGEGTAAGAPGAQAQRGATNRPWLMLASPA